MNYIKKYADISDCGKYRYALSRSWNYDLPCYLFIMLNPSTADADVDDPTIKSCVRIVDNLGGGFLEVVNLFAYRATSPEELYEVDDPVGSDNDLAIKTSVDRCDVIICAWGAYKLAPSRGRFVKKIIQRVHPTLFCLGLTQSGAPKHPLYIKTGTPLVNYG